MLLEIWESLRGYDKWPEVAAKIESSNVERTDHVSSNGTVSYTWASGDQITWTDSRGEKQCADFRVDDESPLYQLVGGEAVKIRYNPARPRQFYFRDLLQSRTRRFFQVALYALILVCFLSLFVMLRWSVRKW
jgi:hypothetical protein